MLYKYVSREVLHYILKGEIRFTQPGAFNDPFELAIEFYNAPEAPPQDLNLSFDISKQRDSLENFLLPDTFESDYCHDLNSRNIRKILDEKIGVLCLSKNKESHLMWSHYASQYAGAMVTFDNEHELFKNSINIEYRKIRPKINIDYLIKHKGNIPISTFYYKPDVWSYEEEIRITKNKTELKEVKSKNGYPILLSKIPLNAIKKITIGERMKPDEAYSIYQKIKNSNIEMDLAAISNRGYTFRYEIIKTSKPSSEMLPLLSPRTAEIFSNEKGYFGDIARTIIEKHPMRKIVSDKL
ncbi:DUF2971 domain-containing protein [Hafnia alvei]|nr:DUF2971 domain-containing protein [Hafnia alvei]